MSESPCISTADLVCVGCGCTDERACRGGCHWVELDPPLCSSCCELAAELGLLEPDDDYDPDDPQGILRRDRDAELDARNPIVEVFQPHEAQRFIEQRRAIGGLR